MRPLTLLCESDDADLECDPCVRSFAGPITVRLNRDCSMLYVESDGVKYVAYLSEMIPLTGLINRSSYNMWAWGSF